MAAIIQIRDGDPWWLSPDIRVVPGADPNGATGMPVAGQENYLWATVHNVGKQTVLGIRVNFYWSNPAAGVLRSTSTTIGSAFVDLMAGESKEVLCITPWVPVVVNNGHECVVAEAITAADPLPTPVPDPFDPQNHHQVAQRNLNLVIVSPMMRALSLPIQISAPQRGAKRVKVHIEQAKLGKEAELALFKGIGAGKVPPTRTDMVHFGLSAVGGCVDEHEKKLGTSIELKVDAGHSAAAYVQLSLKNGKESGYQLLHVYESQDGKLIGGNSILILNP